MTAHARVKTNKINNKKLIGKNVKK